MSDIFAATLLHAAILGLPPSASASRESGYNLLCPPRLKSARASAPRACCFDAAARRQPPIQPAKDGRTAHKTYVNAPHPPGAGRSTANSDVRGAPNRETRPKRGRTGSGSVLKQDSDHPSQGLGRAP